MSKQTNAAIRPKFNWVNEYIDENDALPNLLKRYPKLHSVLAKVLISKGLSSEENVQSYFSNDLMDYLPLCRLKDLHKGANKLQQAVETKQKIRLYGDYDVDGTSSVAMLKLFLEKVNADFDFYIPDRYEEGYGISEAGVQDAISNKVELFISLDCGIRAVDRVAELSAKGIDTIICDHHEPGAVLPAAYAIINHKQIDCTSKNKILCGCGVALVLLFEVIELMNLDIDIDQFIELAAIATCADIVSIRDENRAIVAKGLEVISKGSNIGIKALLRKGGFKEGSVRVSDVVFKIAPRINAAGRMDNAKLAVELLTAKSEDEANLLADRIEQLNTARKERDVIITQEAHEMLLAEDPDLELSSTVLAKPNWHKGLVGIVASRLMETAYRPTIILTEIEGVLTGSARSTPDLDVYQALLSCKDYLIKFGGHSAAAGLTVSVDNFRLFKSAFEKHVKGLLGEGCKQPVLQISLITNFNEWHNVEYQQFYAQLNRLRPYGPGNRQPVFQTSRCIARRVSIVGSEHLRFSVSQANENLRDLPVIAFGFAHLYDHFSAGHEFDMAYTIEENVWNGRRSIQLVAKDFKENTFRW